MMEDLSLHVLDIVENAVAAGATRVWIAINENAARDILSLRVTDNGRGMSVRERARALDPFFLFTEPAVMLPFGMDRPSIYGDNTTLTAWSFPLTADPEGRK